MQAHRASVPAEMADGFILPCCHATMANETGSIKWRLVAVMYQSRVAAGHDLPFTKYIVDWHLHL
jgi:hypothetical protein